MLLYSGICLISLFFRLIFDTLGLVARVLHLYSRCICSIYFHRDLDCSLSVIGIVESPTVST